MPLARLVPLLALAALSVGPARASPCADRIADLAPRVEARSRQAISAATGGQGAAAKRGGEGVTGTEGTGGAPQAPPGMAAQAGQGADAAQQATVALDEARTAEAKGDAPGCEAAVVRAEQHLARAP